ncbi:UNVERIFIED_ORG: hypothetical protein J2S29_004801 [Rhizobium sp. SLBN-170]
MAGAILLELTVGFGGRRSSAADAPSQRMIACKLGRGCFFQFCRQLGFDPTGLTNHRPVDMAIQKRRQFPVDDQTD